ncbi:LacI family DNA-binding transcriptional regulator [Blautia producta]|uniref:LacI family DNA-binding transcriptional regulator n=1 Tax=Blautia producta TaxID=33035 RepID=UPI0031B59EA8
MATIKEIAKACNVSISTVSNILNGKEKARQETKELVLQKAKEMNYVPNYMAKNLKQKNTKTIGIIAEDLTIFHTPTIVDGISACLEKKGYTLLMGNMRMYQKYGNAFYTFKEYSGLVQEEIQEMLAKRVEGIIYVEGHYHVMDHIPELFAVPTVAVYGKVDSREVPSVIYDDEQGGYEAAKALISMGHRKIGVITGSRQSFHTIERMRGFMKALFDHEIPFNPCWEIIGEWNREDGYAGAEQLVQQGVTAIFSMNDIMAGGIYDYINEKGMRIGKDLSVIGFDDREISEAFYPTLSTVALPLNHMGSIAAELLTERLEGKKGSGEKKEYKIPCQVINRNSICKIK